MKTSHDAITGQHFHGMLWPPSHDGKTLESFLVESGASISLDSCSYLILPISRPGDRRNVRGYLGFGRIL